METKAKIILGIFGILLFIGVGVGGFYLGKTFSNYENQENEKNNQDTNEENNNQEDDLTGVDEINQAQANKPKPEDANFVVYQDEMPALVEGKILDNNDIIVQKLHKRLELNYIHKIYQNFNSYENDNFYMDKLVDYTTLSDEAKMYYAYNTIENVERRWFSSCNDLKSYIYNNTNIYNECTSNNEIIMEDYSGFEWFFNDINKAKLTKAYQEFYGNDKIFPLKAFTISVTGACAYSKEKDDYICYKQVGGDMGVDGAETKLVQAVEYNDRIEIYDRYVWYLHSDSKYTFYKSRFQNEKIVTQEYNNDFNIPDEILNQGALYKHTFKKDSTGNYYWYSSERI